MMRKMIGKKGFSLVELMIVVVIMGILIAVAIPLYGAIKDNANNKTCATNIKQIKQNAANYFASYDEKASSLDCIKTMFDDSQIPTCPLGGTYTVVITSSGAAEVACSVVLAGTESSHTDEKTGSLDHAPTATDGDVLS